MLRKIRFLDYFVQAISIIIVSTRRQAFDGDWLIWTHWSIEPPQYYFCVPPTYVLLSTILKWFIESLAIHDMLQRKGEVIDSVSSAVSILDATVGRSVVWRTFSRKKITPNELRSRIKMSKPFYNHTFLTQWMEDRFRQQCIRFVAIDFGISSYDP